VKRLYTTEEDIIAQKQRLARQIDLVSEWIQAFRNEKKETTDEEGDDLDINIGISISGGMTLLHAATFTGDPNLVRKLLISGADPNANSSLGLPIDIARKFDTSNFHEICDILTNGPEKIEQNVKISVNERENQAEAEKKQQVHITLEQ